MSEALSPLMDPHNPQGTERYRAGMPMSDPETGAVLYAPVTDWALKEQQDAEDRYRAQLGKDQKMPNGLYFPVVKVPRTNA